MVMNLYPHVTGTGALPTARTLHWQQQQQQQQAPQQHSQLRLTAANIGRVSVPASEAVTGGRLHHEGGMEGSVAGDGGRGLQRNLSGRSMALTARTQRGPITSAPEEVARVIGQSQVCDTCEECDPACHTHHVLHNVLLVQPQHSRIEHMWLGCQGPHSTEHKRTMQLSVGCKWILIPDACLSCLVICN
jgi:hypothetical protein